MLIANGKIGDFVSCLSDYFLIGLQYFLDYLLSLLFYSFNRLALGSSYTDGWDGCSSYKGSWSFIFVIWIFISSYTGYGSSLIGIFKFN